MLIEQEGNEQPSSVRDNSVADAETGRVEQQTESSASYSTSRSIVDVGTSSSDCDTMTADVETPVTESDEQCQYFCTLIEIIQSLYIHTCIHACISAHMYVCMYVLCMYAGR